MLLLSAAWAAPIASAAETPDPDGENLVWPPAPQPTRIRFLNSIATPEDIGRNKGWFRRVWEFVRGPVTEEMRKPMAVTADTRRIYVADPAAKCIHVFDEVDGDYERWERVGDDQWTFPFGLASDGEGTLYVVDSGLRAVFALDSDGDVRRRYGGKELARPTGVALDAKRGRLYVTDTPEHNIKVYGLDSGELIQVIGDKGTEPGQFRYPSYLSIDAEGRLYVTDGLNARIQVLSPEGEPLNTIGQFGDGSGDFVSPKGVAVDRDGHVYVTDAGFDNVQVFDRQGRLLIYFGTTGQSNAHFWMPTGAYIDDRGRILVADSYNQRVQVFQYVGEGK
ncbi:hypothetical protein [Thiohalomonas denitrificans]|uniref:hypothetical protein n=1 Tax=Thiohalomonas denitrificans TaxID=415747 RepID=UPI0026E9E471|nr:hypothetical protein [Thiohalomonas denitrificans]